MRDPWARIMCANWSRSRIFSSTLSTFVCREAPCNLPPVELVHAALVFEHTGLGCCLKNALSLVAPGGKLSIVLQLPTKTEQDVTVTRYSSMQALRNHFALIDVSKF